MARAAFGIPVVNADAGDYQSVDAVIDKDLSSALLAREIHADILVITGGVEKSEYSFWETQPACTGYGGCPNDGPLHAGGSLPAWEYVTEILASLEFTERGGKRVIITTPECLSAALRENRHHIIHSQEGVN